jgi:fatty-acyl-CoA synthase
VRLFADQLVYIANHAEDEVIFVDRSLMPLLWPLIDDLKTVRHVVVMDDTGDEGVPALPQDRRVLDYEELLSAAAPHSFGVVTDEHRAASMCYTSGTTGDPKGVVYSHRSVLLHSMAAALSDLLGVRESDVVLAVVPMFHANAWGLCQAAAMAGADLVFPGADLSPQSIANLILTESVTLASGVPTIWMGARPYLAGKSHHLRSIVCGGSAVPRALSEAYRLDVGLPLLQAWGMTETSPIAAVSHPPKDLGRASELDWRALTGRVIGGVELNIIDDHGETLPWNGEAVGEIIVRGPWISAAYYGDSDPSKFHGGWLRTGDVGTVLPNGFVRITDRAKDVIKSGGEWISSVELEAHIMAHPDVVEAAVVGVPDPRWQERPLACVVLRSGAAADSGKLKDFLVGRVPKWWIPERWTFIDEVPKTSVGKFDKKVLRGKFAD